jgi:hypothetical protein
VLNSTRGGFFFVEFCSAQGVSHFLSPCRSQPPVSIPKSPEFFVAAGFNFTAPIGAPATNSSCSVPGHALVSSSCFPLVFSIDSVFVATKALLDFPLRLTCRSRPFDRSACSVWPPPSRVGGESAEFYGKISGVARPQFVSLSQISWVWFCLCSVAFISAAASGLVSIPPPCSVHW